MVVTQLIDLNPTISNYLSEILPEEAQIALPLSGFIFLRNITGVNIYFASSRILLAGDRIKNTKIQQDDSKIIIFFLTVSLV
ncbi:MAG: hypothetical protein KME60_05670 [Cyanomargarita calcarea GSE-NOS-MK-12-04C]|uniref:Uncharacterized protein n=1 Tax=Cyanomargarita calcarea GSE-NOS-MK-12-04C TaxID=2839659 RepID=A0A951QKA1_9CYAN|nr:hypothetical protein [Cyanomargarita calcarea GSE-NOS-MK-12-04C]